MSQFAKYQIIEVDHTCIRSNEEKYLAKVRDSTNYQAPVRIISQHATLEQAIVRLREIVKQVTAEDKRNLLRSTLGPKNVFEIYDRTLSSGWVYNSREILY